MAKAIATPVFDYSQVDKDTAGKLRYFAAEIIKAKKAHAEAIIETGRLLADAQKVMAKRGDGTFIEWMDRECGLAKRTGYNYLAAYREFGDCATVAQIEPSAMYALAENELAKKAALKLAAKGETITQKVAKELVTEAKEREIPPPPKPKPAPAPDDEIETQTGEPCPNCGSTIWSDKDGHGLACDKCLHPFGEPLGDLDEGEPEWKTQQKKTIKTIEALMRAFDDLHRMKAKRQVWDDVVNREGSVCKELLKVAREW